MGQTMTHYLTITTTSKMSLHRTTSPTSSLTTPHNHGTAPHLIRVNGAICLSRFRSAKIPHPRLPWSGYPQRHYPERQPVRQFRPNNYTETICLDTGSTTTFIDRSLVDTAKIKGTPPITAKGFSEEQVLDQIVELPVYILSNTSPSPP